MQSKIYPLMLLGHLANPVPGCIWCTWMGFDPLGQHQQLKNHCFCEFCGIWESSWQQQLDGFACSLTGADKVTDDTKTSVVAAALGEPDKAKAAAPDTEGKEEKPEATAQPEAPAEQPVGQEGEPPRGDGLAAAVTPSTPCPDTLVLTGAGAASQGDPKADLPGLPQPSDSAGSSGSPTDTARTGGVLVSRAETKLGRA